MRSTISMALMGMAGAMLVACGSGSSSEEGSTPAVDESDLAAASLENRATAALDAPPVGPSLGRTGGKRGQGRAHVGRSGRGRR
jgi:hypothetical protein